MAYTIFLSTFIGECGVSGRCQRVRSEQNPGEAPRSARDEVVVVVVMNRARHGTAGSMARSVMSNANSLIRLAIADALAWLPQLL